MLGDLKYAVRILAKSPVFTGIAIATLALGIGANTAIFSVANALLVRALPYARPNQLVLVSGSDFNGDGSYGRLSYPFFRLVRDHGRSYSSVAACIYETFNLTGRGPAEQIVSARASWNFFDLLGVPPIAGRSFRPEEDVAGGPNAVVLSYEFATRLFANPNAALGQTLSLDARDYTVIGVLAPSFRFVLFGSRREIWAARPFEMNYVTPARVELGGPYFNVIGRLLQGASRDQATAELEVLYNQYRLEQPRNYDATLSLRMATPDLQSQLVSEIRPTILILSAAVGLVLLVACANVASLLLSRALGRKKEFAVRAALGGSRAALIRQLLTESAVIAGVSGVAGIGLAFLGIRLLAGLSGNTFMISEGSSRVFIDPRVLGFTLAVSIASGILFGLAPSLELSKADVNRALRDEGRSSTGNLKQSRARGVLVVGQVALSMILVVGAGLLIKSFARLRMSPAGFDSTNLLTMRVSLMPSRYSEPAQMNAFYRNALERVQTLPGVEAAAISTALPGSWTHLTPMLFEGHPAVPLGQRPTEAIQQISPNYLKVMRIPLVGGRMFDERDDERSKPVALVNEIAARKFWPNESAIGKRIWIGTMVSPFEVVGVIGDTKNRGLAVPPSPEVFEPYPQLPFLLVQMTVRTFADAHSVAGAVRARLESVDLDEPVTDVQTMQEHLETLNSPTRFTTILLVSFSGLAFLLAVVGLYGAIAYSVAQRQQELGIRIALGAARWDIFRLVIGGGLKLTAAGIVIGVAGAAALTRVMGNLLYQTSATDPATFFASALLFFMTALLASYTPARRAAAIDPTAALRGE